MKKISLYLILLCFVYAHTMEKEEENKPPTLASMYDHEYKIIKQRILEEKEKRKQSLGIPSHHKGAQSLIEKVTDELFERYVSQLDGSNTQEIIQAVNDFLKILVEPVAQQIKNKFVERYANKLGFTFSREICDPETGESTTICFDQRCITSKQEGDVFITKYPIPTSPWNSLSFEELLSAYNKQKKVAQFFVDQGKDHGKLWPDPFKKK